MSYKKHNWVVGTSPITSKNLNELDAEVERLGQGGGSGYTAGDGIVIEDSEISIDEEVVAVKGDLQDYATIEQLEEGLDEKQDTLVSGTNIKTINSTSILGSGDIVISGGAVDSVNGQTGIVVLTADDIDATNTQSVQENLERIDLEVEGLVDDVADLNSGKLDASKSAVATVGGLVIPTSSPTSLELVGVDTDNSQARIALGLGVGIATVGSDKTMKIVGVTNQNGSVTSIKFWTGTQSEYDAITTKDATTLYTIVGE